MLHGLLVLAADAAEPSKVPFYIAAGLLAAWAVVLGAIGLNRPGFPGGLRGERMVITLSVVLAGATMAMAVVTA